MGLSVLQLRLAKLPVASGDRSQSTIDASLLHHQQRLDRRRTTHRRTFFMV
jgi:hypothetical protein